MASALSCFTCSTRHTTTAPDSSALVVPRSSHRTPPTLSLRPISHSSRFQYLKAKATEKDQTAKKTQKSSSLVCTDCEGNGACSGYGWQARITVLNDHLQPNYHHPPGAILCTQCEGSGVNSVDHFNGRFKTGGLCWLCRGKREILCGNCNGAGFMGGFMSTLDETAN